VVAPDGVASAPNEGGAINVDLGDITAVFELRIKGKQRRRFVWHVGPPRDTTAEDRVVNGPPYAQTPRLVDFIMDLQADKQVTLTGTWTDELGNTVEAPADAEVAFTVDDPTIINLTDNGDGTAVAAAVGTLGTANVHGEATGDGQTVTGDFQIVVVAGLAERFTIVAGEPTEVTPDE
jgi:hypothetical protein